MENHKLSNIEVVEGGRFHPNENIVPVEKNVANHPNADIYYDKTNDKIILVPDDTHIQGATVQPESKIDQKLNELTESAKGFGVKTYDAASDLTDKISRSTEQTAERVQERATEFSEDAKGKGTSIMDTITEMQTNITNKVTNFLGIGTSNQQPTQPSTTTEVPERNPVLGPTVEDKVLEALGSKPVIADKQDNTLSMTPANKNNATGTIGGEPTVSDKISQSATDTATKVQDETSNFAHKVYDKVEELKTDIKEKVEELKTDIKEKVADLSAGHNATGITNNGAGPLTKTQDDVYFGSIRTDPTDFTATEPIVSDKVSQEAIEKAAELQDKASGLAHTIAEKAEQIKTDLQDKFSELSQDKTTLSTTEPAVTDQQKTLLTTMADDAFAGAAL